jgi:hypothetical protein
MSCVRTHGGYMGTHPSSLQRLFKALPRFPPVYFLQAFRVPVVFLLGPYADRRKPVLPSTAGGLWIALELSSFPLDVHKVTDIPLHHLCTDSSCQLPCVL